jgi:hypothetical protein
MIINKIRIALVFCFCIIATNNINAQYSLNPSSTFIQNSYFQAMDYDGITIRNESPEVLNLEWKFVSMDTIPGCVFDLCATGECHLGIPAFGYFPPIAVGDTGFLNMHFWTGDVVGMSIAKVYIFDAAHPNNGDTLTYILNVIGPNNIGRQADNSKFSFYPNPAEGSIYITADEKSTYSLSIYNFVGQLMIQETNLIGKQNISVEKLPAGFYQVIYKDEFNRVIAQRLQRSIN